MNVPYIDSTTTTYLDPVAVPDTACLHGTKWQIFTGMSTANGMPGDLLPYSMSKDDVVVSALIVSFFLSAWVVTRSWRFIVESYRDFFHPREKTNIFDKPTADMVLRGSILLVILTCIVVSALGLYFSPNITSSWRREASIITLGGFFVLCLLYYLVKYVLYLFVNFTFFTDKQRATWRNSYRLSILTMGILLQPIVLLGVFGEWPQKTLLTATIFVIGVVKMLLVYKCYSIFFRGLDGVLHIILYFCTLEIAPLLFLIAAMQSLNDYISTTLL